LDNPPEKRIKNGESPFNCSYFIQIWGFVKVKRRFPVFFVAFERKRGDRLPANLSKVVGKRGGNRRPAAMVASKSVIANQCRSTGVAIRTPGGLA
jgi:hypothetical protein